MVRKDQIQHLIRSLETLPTLPSVAVGIAKIALRHDRYVEDLTRCIEVDPALTVRVLRAANSSPYRRSGSITTLPDAIGTLGARALQSLVLSLSVMDVFADRMATYAIDPVNLWLHSIATALYARELSQHVELLDPHEAFTAGLIHDIGKILLLISLEEDYPRVISRAGADHAPLFMAERDRLSYDHAEVGKWLLEQWDIPSIYVEVILQHHHPVEAAFSDRRHFLLACIVALGNHLSYCHNLGSGGDPGKASTSPGIHQRLGIPQKIVEQIARDVPLQFKKMAGQASLKPAPLSAYHSILKKANRVLGRIHQDHETAHHALVQKEKELSAINAVGLLLLGCTTAESAVKIIAEGLIEPFNFSRVICTVVHHDHWEYRADAMYEGKEWICHTQFKTRSQEEEGLPEPQGTEPWLHIDLIGKHGLLGCLQVKPGRHSAVPLEKLGLLLASYAKLVSEALERIQAHQRIQGLSEDLTRSIARLDNEKEKVECEKIQKENILTSLSIGLLLLDEAGTIGFCNPEAETLFLPGQPLLGERIQELFKDPEITKGLSTALHGTRVPPHEFSVPGIDPLTMKTIRWSLIPIRKGEGRVSQLLLIMEDISEEKELQRQIIHSARMASIGELAAGTAHNLRSPLGAVKGILELLVEEIETGRMTITSTEEHGTPLTDAIADQLRVIIRSVGKCFSVIDDLLNYSRTRDHSPEMLRLQELLDGTEALIGELLADRKIAIEKDLQSDILFGRKADLMQVFLNLYSNAYKAMPQGGLLKIHSRPCAMSQTARPYTEILVMDTGHGIAPEYLTRIFDPFFTTAERVEGTGLGLSLTHKIVQDHGGSIDVESRVGEGTTFILMLPAGPDISMTQHT